MPDDVPARSDPNRRSRLALAGFLAFAGSSHFWNASFFDDLVPEWMPGDARTWTTVSGLAELAAAALVANRKTSRTGGWAALIVFVSVYPANIWDTVTHPPTDARGVGSLIRLPLQLLLFRWALKHARAPMPTVVVS